MPERIEMDRASIDLNTYPVEYVGSFACSDPLLTRIREAGRATIHLSMLDRFVNRHRGAEVVGRDDERLQLSRSAAIPDAIRAHRSAASS